MIDQKTTIVATATATGGAISVIRLSGPDACGIVSKVFSGKLEDRKAVFGVIRNPQTGQVLDEVLCVAYIAPRSYTGQDCVEISCHGSSYITQSIIDLLIEHGAVSAQPGEFTLRAFLSGKLDLSQAEAVADIISSESSSAASIALRQMRGGYSQELKTLSDKLLHILSLLELELDFGEEDVEFADRSLLEGMLCSIIQKVKTLADSYGMGNVMRLGVPVAIVGRPNVGKSTLLNQLVGHQRAIVSDIAGTTRDFIEESMVVDGLKFRFIDTAGLRKSDDQIEMLGVERSYDKIREAKVILYLSDVENDFDLSVVDNITSEQILVKVINKCDDMNSESCDSDHACINNDAEPELEFMRISAKNGIGVDGLKKHLLDRVGYSKYDSSSIVVSNARHHRSLVDALVSFESSIELLRTGYPTDIITSEIRNGLSCIGEITGDITTDDILKNIFSKFCIGK